jgi:hypothetical protein
MRITILTEVTLGSPLVADNHCVKFHRPPESFRESLSIASLHGTEIRLHSSRSLINPKHSILNNEVVSVLLSSAEQAWIDPKSSLKPVLPHLLIELSARPFLENWERVYGSWIHFNNGDSHLDGEICAPAGQNL